jgi:hypothetical protein
MGFPPPGAEIHYNDAGEVLGWDMPADEGTYWCDECGFSHPGPCPDPYDPDEDDEDGDGDEDEE